ncbi:MAG: hypothetical protein IJB77_02005 [Bacteroidaceae bacterium]|nr:hypothetical protein [Bacteroidaceae bacterium]
MKLRNLLPMAMIAASALSSCNTTIEKSDRALTPVSFEKVTLNDNFWLPRLQTQKKTLVPFALGKTETAVENLRRTAAYLRGEKSEKLLPLAFYVSSDLFKVMEGAAYLLTLEKDEGIICTRKLTSCGVLRKPSVYVNRMERFSLPSSPMIW